MKKLFLFIVLSFLVLGFNACSGDDDEQDKDSTEATINPPNWLIGTWRAPSLGQTHKFEFTKSNYIFTQIGIVYNFAEIDKQDIYTVKELVNTDNEYQISKVTNMVGTGSTATETHKFVKDSGGNVTYYLLEMTSINPVAIPLERIN